MAYSAPHDLGPIFCLSHLIPCLRSSSTVAPLLLEQAMLFPIASFCTWWLCWCFPFAFLYPVFSLSHLVLCASRLMVWIASMNTLASWLPVGIGQWEALPGDQRESEEEIFIQGIYHRTPAASLLASHLRTIASLYQRPQLLSGSSPSFGSHSSLCPCRPGVLMVPPTFGSPGFGSPR